MSARSTSEQTRDGVGLTHLEESLSPDLGVSKRVLVDYLDAMADRIVPVLADRALSVIRVRPGQPPFMQKNTPGYAPEWVATLAIWSPGSRREIRYPLCQDRRTLLWLANQRAVEFHPTLFTGSDWDRPSHLVIDLDPPEGAPFDQVVATAHAVQEALAGSGLQGAAKTSGSKGLHVVVPLAEGTTAEEAAAATRALAARTQHLAPEVATTQYLREDRAGKVFVDSTRSGGGTLAAVYSPRARPGLPVSFPVPWAELDAVRPSDFTVSSALDRLAGADLWSELLPGPQSLDPELVAQGRQIPVARVAAMHEGKRRKRAAEQG